MIIFGKDFDFLNMSLHTLRCLFGAKLISIEEIIEQFNNFKTKSETETKLYQGTTKPEEEAKQLI